MLLVVVAADAGRVAEVCGVEASLVAGREEVICGVEAALVTGRDEDICGVCVAWPVAVGRVGLE